MNSIYNIVVPSTQVVPKVVSNSTTDIVTNIVTESFNKQDRDYTSENKTQSFNIVLVLVTWVLVSVVVAMILSRMITVGKGR